MKIFKPIGSKERFFEVFQNVTKVKLNEEFEQSLNPQSVFEVAFEALKSGKLKVIHSSTQTGENENYIELICKDNQNNNITFTFKVKSLEGAEDNVFTVGDVALTSFSFDSADGVESIEIDEKNLETITAQHKDELLNIVDDYMDVGAETNVSDEELAEAVKIIDAIKIDSMPFGGEFETIQKSKNYGDEKPVNPELRVNAPELDKFVKEDLERKPDKEGGDLIRMFPSDIPQVDKQLLYTKMFKNDINYLESLPPQILSIFREKASEMVANKLGVPQVLLPKVISWENFLQLAALELAKVIHDDRISKLNENSGYPEKIGKEFSPPPSYPKKKKKYSKKVKIKRSPTAPKPHTINEAIYDTEDDDFEVTDLEIPYDPAAKKQASTDIKQDIDTSNIGIPKGETRKQPISYKTRFSFDESLSQKASDNPELIKFYNEHNTEISDDWDEYLTRLRDSVEHVMYLRNCDECFWEWIDKNYWDEATQSYVYNYPAKAMDECNVEEKKSENEPAPVPTIDPPVSQMGKNLEDDGMSLEPEGDKIADLAQQREEGGNTIEGGVGDDTSPIELDPEQILMGMKVEMEHTDDPLLALDIAIDHLVEIPDYYTRLDKMEKDAKGGENSKNDDTEDVLLGYKPKNVGDYVDDEEEEEEELETNDEKSKSEPKSEVEPEEKSDDEDKLFESKNLWKNIHKAKIVAKLPKNIADSLSGMNKEKALKLLNEHNIKIKTKKG